MEVTLPLASWPVLSGVGVGVGAALIAIVVASGLTARPSRGFSAFSAVLPSWELRAHSAFGPRLVSVGSQCLNQVGLETETRATVTSGLELVVMGTLAEARVATGDDIGPPRKPPRWRAWGG